MYIILSTDKKRWNITAVINQWIVLGFFGNQPSTEPLEETMQFVYTNCKDDVLDLETCYG